MDDTLSLMPFSLTKFQEDLLSQNQRDLLRWADTLIYMAFVRHAQGEEEPAVLQVESVSRYIASPSADILYELLEGAKLPEGSEVVAKPLPLHEAARRACLFQVGLQLLDKENSQYIATPITSALGMAAVVESPAGEDVIYKAEPFVCEPGNDIPTLPYGCVQYWYDATVEYDEDTYPERSTSIYVYDDRLDWRHPHAPDLPEGSHALSTLSAGAQAFFERTRWPLPPSEAEKPAAPAEPTPRYRNDLIDSESLPAFEALRAMVDRDIVPPASGITLEVVKAPPLQGEDDTPERWEVRVRFTTPMGIKALFEPDWVEASLCRDNPALPDDPGTHHASDALREHIVDRLAWVFLHKSRSFDLTLFGYCLTGLLPGIVINSQQAYQPDYTDRRFPCLARFQCDDVPVPVLLLGEQGSHYVCQPLKDTDVPESKVPSVIPGRSGLIDMVSRTMALSNADDRLLLPASLIDFPQPWYEGIRVSQQSLKDKFVSYQRVNHFLDQIEQAERTKTGTGVKWILAACAIALIVTVIMTLNL